MLIIDQLVSFWLKHKQAKISREWEELLLEEKIPVPGDIFGYFSPFPEKLPSYEDVTEMQFIDSVRQQTEDAQRRKRERAIDAVIPSVISTIQRAASSGLYETSFGITETGWQNFDMVKDTIEEWCRKEGFRYTDYTNYCMINWG